MKKKQEILLIKPHHFLDIIKLYGSGLDSFVPNVEYGHDFWKVGNIILSSPNVQLELTIDNDSICIPCKFNNGKICSGITSADLKDIPKDTWNKIIDRRLLKLMNFKNGDRISAFDFCKLAKEKISKENIFEIWKEKPAEITEKRAIFLVAGVDKYIKKYEKDYKN